MSKWCGLYYKVLYSGAGCVTVCKPVRTPTPRTRMTTSNKHCKESRIPSQPHLPQQRQSTAVTPAAAAAEYRSDTCAVQSAGRTNLCSWEGIPTAPTTRPSPAGSSGGVTSSTRAPRGIPARAANSPPPWRGCPRLTPSVRTALVPSTTPSTTGTFPSSHLRPFGAGVGCN